MAELKTNFPQESGEYKVVQLEMDNQQYLWLVERGGHPYGLTYLLEEEGKRFGIYAEKENKPYRKWSGKFAKAEEQTGIRTYKTVDDLAASTLEFWDEHVPALSGEGYQVLGMGKVSIEAEKKIATFHGKSQSYGIGIDVKQLSLLEKLNLDWVIKKNDK